MVRLREADCCQARVAGTEYDYTGGRRIGSAVLDTSFGGLERGSDGTVNVTLATPDGAGVTVWADEAFRWFQVFTSDTLPAPRLRAAVAIEPMTCPPDALNSGTDLRSLEPGQAWTGRWGVANLEVCTAAIESSRTGKEIELKHQIAVAK